MDNNKEKNFSIYNKKFKSLEKKMVNSFEKLSSSVKKGENKKRQIKEINDLFLLLGEFKYLIDECDRIEKEK